MARWLRRSGDYSGFCKGHFCTFWIFMSAQSMLECTIDANKATSDTHCLWLVRPVDLSARHGLSYEYTLLVAGWLVVTAACLPLGHASHTILAFSFLGGLCFGKTAILPETTSAVGLPYNDGRLVQNAAFRLFSGTPLLRNGHSRKVAILPWASSIVGLPRGRSRVKHDGHLGQNAVFEDGHVAPNILHFSPSEGLAEGQKRGAPRTTRVLEYLNIILCYFYIARVPRDYILLLLY